MKKGIVFLMILLPAAILHGQPKEYLLPEGSATDKYVKELKNKRDCDARVERADSVINFGYNASTGEFFPAEVRKYTYDTRDNLTVIHLKSLPDRTNVLRQVFDYDNYGNQTGYANYSWINGAWEKTLFVVKSYSPEGRLTTEVYHNRDAEGNFRPYMQHFFNYSGTQIVSYLRQIKNAQGQWYDFSYHNYVYDNLERLTQLYGQYINGPVFWERTSVFEGDGSSAVQRYLRQLKYDPVLKQNVLTNITREDYSFNIYDNVSEILYHSWAANDWSVSGKAIIYYSLLQNKKVSICHNGMTLCVSVNAVKAHLEHGDKLGACPVQESTPVAEEPFSLYPNPATVSLSVQFMNGEHGFVTGYIVTQGSRVVQSFSVAGRSEVTLNVSGLKPGHYYIRLTGQGTTTTQTFIKK